MNKLFSTEGHTVLLFGLISVAALSSGCWRGVSRQVLATVLSFHGDVAYQGSEQERSQPLTLETNPGSGSVLRTSGGGRADLALIPGALLHISSNSEVRIEELRLTKDGNETEDGMRERTARVSLKRGSVTIVVERRDESELRFAIGTIAGKLSADQDCVCQVHLDNGHGRVTCVRGKAYAAGTNSEPTTIKEGYFQKWPGGAIAPAEEDARAQADVADTLEAARVLQQLQLAQVNRRPR